MSGTASSVAWCGENAKSATTKCRAAIGARFLVFVSLLARGSFHSRGVLLLCGAVVSSMTIDFSCVTSKDGLLPLTCVLIGGSSPLKDLMKKIRVGFWYFLVVLTVA